jgi:hypothetical protein
MRQLTRTSLHHFNSSANEYTLDFRIILDMMADYFVLYIGKFCQFNEKYRGLEAVRDHSIQLHGGKFGVHYCSIHRP